MNAMMDKVLPVKNTTGPMKLKGTGVFSDAMKKAAHAMKSEGENRAGHVIHDTESKDIADEGVEGDVPDSENAPVWRGGTGRGVGR